MTNFKNSILALGGIALMLSAASCKNGNNEFPDFEGGVSVYFAYQYPAHLMPLGDWPDGDNSLENQHKIQILATQGGAYKSKDGIKIDVMVDPTLVDNLYFPDGSPVKAMPDNYYKLASTTFTKKADYLFGSEVELSDAFFADPDAIKNTYVIPLRILKASGADRILSGTAINPEANPSRTDASAWSVQPQDFVLYCVKYANPWDASYLRRGVDVVDGKDRVVRRGAYREQDEVVSLSTKSMTEVVFPVSTIVPDGSSVKTLTCDMVLNFSGDDCSISTSTPGMTASGSGKFVKLGEKKGFNNEDHNVIYLDYTVNFGPRQFQTKDTLVVRSRMIEPEFDFKPTYKK